MKIIKNRIIQILAVMILLVVGVFSVNHFASPVMASDELTKGEFNAKMKEIENEFAELKAIIEEQQNEIDNLKTEINNNEDTIKDLKTTINKYEKDITKLNKWYDKNKKLYVDSVGNWNGKELYMDVESIRNKLHDFFKEN